MPKRACLSTAFVGPMHEFQHMHLRPAWLLRVPAECKGCSALGHSRPTIAMVMQAQHGPRRLQQAALMLWCRYQTSPMRSGRVRIPDGQEVCVLQVSHAQALLAPHAVLACCCDWQAAVAGSSLRIVLNIRLAS